MDSIPPRRTVVRSSRKKVKSGCRTCKLRKVKCDEHWPVCRRCQSSGRSCAGYGVWGGGSVLPVDSRTRQHSSVQVAAETLPKTVQLLTLAQDELHCFEWYMHRSCSKLPGLFKSENWSSLIFQASTREASIRHAVLALASAHQEEVKGASSLSCEPNDGQSRFTVAQYGKALALLRPSLSDLHSGSLRTALLTCAFLVYSDFMRGHYTRGIVHLRHGLSLIPSLAVSSVEYDPSSTVVDSWVMTVLTRLLVQARLLGQRLSLPPQDLMASGLQLQNATFQSIHHARRSLDHLFLQTFYLEDQALQRNQSGVAAQTRDLLSGQRSLHLELQEWLRILESTLRLLPVARSLQAFLERFAYQVLRLYHRLAIILADTCIEVCNERRFDRHESTFVSIVAQTIGIHKITYPGGKLERRGIHDPEPTSPNSVVDIGWLGVLFVTAIKCRNHRLRHQAVRLMSSSQHREGIWDSKLAIEVARRIIEMEEGTFYHDLTELRFDTIDIPNDNELATPTLPEESRVRIVDLILPEDRAGRLRLGCIRTGTGTGSGTGIGIGVGLNTDYEWIDQEYDLCTKQWTTIS